MTTRRTGAIVAVALCAVLLAALLTTPEAPDSDLAERAAAVAAQAERQSAADPTALLAATRAAAGAGGAIRILDARGRVLASDPVGRGNRAAVVVAVPSSQGSNVALVEVSAPAASGRLLSGARVAAIAACGVLLTLLALVGLRGRRHAERAPQAAPLHHEPPVPDAAAEQRADERGRLVRGLIAVVDNSNERYVTARALDALEDAGVEAIEPAPGNRFDPGSQAIGGVVETDDASLHEDVIAVLRPGFSDHGRLVREAEVQVYVPRADGERPS